MATKTRAVEQFLKFEFVNLNLSKIEVEKLKGQYIILVNVSVREKSDNEVYLMSNSYVIINSQSAVQKF